jgi:hypothetical protein
LGVLGSIPESGRDSNSHDEKKNERAQSPFLAASGEGVPKTPRVADEIFEDYEELFGFRYNAHIEFKVQSAKCKVAVSSSKFFLAFEGGDT